MDYKWMCPPIKRVYNIYSLKRLELQQKRLLIFLKDYDLSVLYQS